MKFHKLFAKTILSAVIALALGMISSSTAAAQEVIFSAGSFSAADGSYPEGWTVWSNREETLPQFSVSERSFPGSGDGSLQIYGKSTPRIHGCWVKRIEGIEAGAWYKIEARYTTRSVDYPRQKVFARLVWKREDDGRAGRPEYVPDVESAGEWKMVSSTYQAPEKAVAVNLELYLSHSDQGTVWWDDIKLTKVEQPAPRKARVAVINLYPHGNKTSMESIEDWLEMVDKAGQMGADIVCLGEGINLAGVVGAEYPDVAEPVPGPSTEALGRMAARHSMYIVGALGELESGTIYNTGVLIGRDGELVGKYRKVQIPREEFEGGVMPGSSFPVFDTDFGKVGIMICWDSQYPLPARALAARGAELIMVPIWGGNPTLMKARAIENQVYIATCAYSDLPTAVYGPDGTILAEATERGTVAIAEIDFSKPFYFPWLGNMKDRLVRERRADIKVLELEN